MTRKNHFLAALLLAACAPLVMACDKSATPTLPDPASAVTPQIINAKNDVKAFLGATEVYLKCNLSSKQHNSMADEMKAVAADIKTIVHAYKSRMAS